MAKTALALAEEVLREEGGLEAVRVHEFVDDAAAHDDAGIAKVYAEFAGELERISGELAEVYGAAMRVGDRDDEVIPLNGVRRFAMWEVEGRVLFVAVAHEDRELPVLLMMGSA